MLTSAALKGDEIYIGWWRHPQPACGREAPREKLRECSGPGSFKSGDWLPEGASVLSKLPWRRQHEMCVLTYGPFTLARPKWWDRHVPVHRVV